VILPSQTNTKRIRHDVFDPSLFDNAKIAGIELGEMFDDEKITYDWLKKHRAYPAGLALRTVHKCIIYTSTGRFVDGLNNDKNRYLVFSAYHIETKYALRIRDRYFPIMFPSIAFKEMWDTVIPYSFNQCKDMLIEIHFQKKNRKIYIAKYVAQTQQLGEGHFRRLEVFYKEPKYTGDKI
jgi:hypothetical protein